MINENIALSMILEQLDQPFCEGQHTLGSLQYSVHHAVHMVN